MKPNPFRVNPHVLLVSSWRAVREGPSEHMTAWSPHWSMSFPQAGQMAPWVNMGTPSHHLRRARNSSWSSLSPSCRIGGALSHWADPCLATARMRNVSRLEALDNSRRRALFLSWTSLLKARWVCPRQFSASRKGQDGRSSTLAGSVLGSEIWARRHWSDMGAPGIEEGSTELTRRRRSRMRLESTTLPR